MTSLNKNNIQALSIYQNPLKEECIFFAATQTGYIEVWKRSHDEISLMTKISTGGTICTLVYEPVLLGTRNNGWLFIGHHTQSKIPLVSVYQIDPAFSLGTKMENISWPKDYAPGKLVALKTQIGLYQTIRYCQLTYNRS